MNFKGIEIISLGLITINAKKRSKTKNKRVTMSDTSVPAFQSTNFIILL